MPRPPAAAQDETRTLVATLICELRGGTPACKRAAARRLGELGAAALDAVPALKDALEDIEVCFDAHEALKRLWVKASGARSVGFEPLSG